MIVLLYLPRVLADKVAFYMLDSTDERFFLIFKRSRKRVELIWFEKIDFPKSITEILLNIRIFLENFGSSLKKSILFKLLRTLRRIIFLWILPWRVDVKYHFTRLYATKDAKNYRRKAF